ncbi:MAG: hypothetical protein ACRC38_07225, partial [Plesiomonas sp.]
MPRFFCTFSCVKIGKFSRFLSKYPPRYRHLTHNLRDKKAGSATKPDPFNVKIVAIIGKNPLPIRRSPIKRSPASGAVFPHHPDQFVTYPQDLSQIWASLSL